MWWWLTACAPVLDDDTPYVDDPRILAVRVAPPEVLPDEAVTLTALWADASGALSTAPLDWSFCTAPKPLAELGPVSGSCLDPDSDDLEPIGDGVEVVGTVPSDVCSVFGPNPPAPREGQLAGRPADPDITGGFYQPALVFPADADPVLVSIRVRCGLANVTQETYVAWNLAYVSNQNPAVSRIDVDGGEVPASVTAGDTVTIHAEWAGCDEAPCTGAEPYVVYDPDVDALVDRREAISATWFATGGTFDVARNGRAGEDQERTVANAWTAPDEPGEVWLSVVLRDERGGVDFASFGITVVDP